MGFNGKFTVSDTTLILIKTVTVKLWFYAGFIQKLEDATPYKLQFSKISIDYSSIHKYSLFCKMNLFKQSVFFLEYKQSKWVTIFFVFATSLFHFKACSLTYPWQRKSWWSKFRIGSHNNSCKYNWSNGFYWQGAGPIVSF